MQCYLMHINIDQKKLNKLWFALFLQTFLNSQNQRMQMIHVSPSNLIKYLELHPEAEQ